MIPSMIAKKVLPYLLEPLTSWLFKMFPGINKIPYLVKYMEDDNEADQKIKLLEKGFMQLAEEIDELKKKLNG